MTEVTIRMETLDEFEERTKKEFKKLEEGELETPQYGISFDPNNLPKAFTKKRIQLLLEVSNKKIKSIRELAETLQRDYKSVYGDVQRLADMGFLKLEKQGKAKSPVEITMPYDKIVLDFGEKAET